MADTTKGKDKSKLWKIVGIIVFLLILGAIIYYFFKGGSDAASKAKSGKYGTWGEGKVPGGDVNWYPFLNKCTELFGADSQPYASAWLKGMNVARSIANLTEFKAEITAYVNSSTRKVDWEMEVGALLK